MQNKAKGGGGRRNGRGSGGGEREEEVRASKTITKKIVLYFLLLTNYNMRRAPLQNRIDSWRCQDRGVDSGKRKKATCPLKSLEAGAPPNRSHSPTSVIRDTRYQVSSTLKDEVSTASDSKLRL